MKKIFSLIFIIFLLGGFNMAKAQNDDWKNIRVGVYDNYPKIYKNEGGEIKGFWADIVNYIAEQEDWDLNYVHGTWDEGLERLKKGEIDLMVDMAVSEERKEEYNFNQEVALISWGIFYTREGLNINSFYDLEGKDIAILKSGIHYQSPVGLENLLNSFGVEANIVDVDKYEDTFKFLDEKRADVGVVSWYFGIGNEDKYRVQRTNLIFNPSELKLATQKNGAKNQYILAVIDKYLKSLKEDKGSIYYESIRRNFGRGLEKVEVLPHWLKYSLLFLFLFIIVFLISLLFSKRYQKKLEKEVDDKVKKIRESEKKLREIAKNSKDAIFSKDSKRRYTFVNPAAAQMIGLPEKDIIGKTPEEVFEKKNIPIIKKADEKNLAGKEVDAVRALNIGGKDYYLHVIQSPIKNEKGKVVGIAGVVRDVTGEKEMEKALRQEKEKAERYLSLAGVIILSLDSQGVVKMINKKGNKVLGYKNGELVGKNWFDCCVPEENKQEIKKVFKTAVKGKIKMIEYYENPVRTKNGKERIIAWHNTVVKEEGGKIKEVLCSGEDITEKKRAELEIRKLAAISYYNTELINIANLDGQMTFINRAGGEMLGIDPKEVHKHHVMEVIPERLKEKVDKEVLPTLRKGKIWEGELAYKNLKTGKVIDVHVIAFTVNDEDTGKPLFMANISLDITKQKQIDRMKSEFIAITSHQLKTPLTGIKWTTELLQSDKIGKLNKVQKELVEQIQGSNFRLLELVSDLLDVSHIETGRKFGIVKRKIKFKEEIESVLREEDNLIKKRKIKIKLDKKLKKNLEVFADQEKIKQAVQHIITNAIKYSRKGGDVEIGVSEDDKKKTVFFVRDKGVGIPKNQQGRVFEKFFRGSNVITETEGTGLGLFITRAIIRGHGGEIWFESGKDKGTTFYFSIPKK